jgi:hypothetical protein
MHGKGKAKAAYQAGNGKILNQYGVRFYFNQIAEIILKLRNFFLGVHIVDGYIGPSALFTGKVNGIAEFLIGKIKVPAVEAHIKTFAPKVHRIAPGPDDLPENRKIARRRKKFYRPGVKISHVQSF